VTDEESGAGPIVDPAGPIPVADAFLRAVKAGDVGEAAVWIDEEVGEPAEHMTEWQKILEHFDPSRFGATTNRRVIGPREERVVLVRLKESGEPEIYWEPTELPAIAVDLRMHPEGWRVFRVSVDPNA